MISISVCMSATLANGETGEPDLMKLQRQISDIANLGVIHVYCRFDYFHRFMTSLGDL